MVAEETIMICIDNSRWMLSLNRYSYGLQLACIRPYCRAKLKSNPKNAIGIVTMGTADDNNWLRPTSDLDKILGHLQCEFLIGGELNFRQGFISSMIVLLREQPSKRKRMLFFTGGPPNLDIPLAERFGGGLKQHGVAVDIVNFCLLERHDYWKRALNVFVAASNNNNNSHIRHIHPDSFTRIRDVLSSNPAIISRSSLKKVEIARKKQSQRSQGEESSAAHDEYVEARGMERGKHNPLEVQNKFKALSPDDE